MMRAVHAARFERWLGRDVVESLSAAMRPWYGTPLPVAGVPGRVWVTRGGDFVGRIEGGGFASAADYWFETTRAVLCAWSRRQRVQVNTGFADLYDLIQEARSGKWQPVTWQKTGTTGATGRSNTLWNVGAWPVAGSRAANAPGGTVFDRTSAGALAFQNPTVAGDTIHLGTMSPSVQFDGAGNTLLLYDRLFSVDSGLATGGIAVTGVPTRYQSTTQGAPDSAENNFLTMEVFSSSLTATAHNFNAVQYTDESGTAAVNLPTVAGVASAAVNTIDLPAGYWFAPLASGDRGIKKLTQVGFDSNPLVSAFLNYTLGHPLGVLPVPAQTIPFLIDGINSCLNLSRVFADACLAFIEITKPNSTAGVYRGHLALLGG